MQSIFIFLVFFLIVAAVDLPPLFKRKAWDILAFSIPAYVIALILNLTLVQNPNLPSITKLLEGMLSNFVT